MQICSWFYCSVFQDCWQLHLDLNQLLIYQYHAFNQNSKYGDYQKTQMVDNSNETRTKTTSSQDQHSTSQLPIPIPSSKILYFRHISFLKRWQCVTNYIFQYQLQCSCFEVFFAISLYVCQICFQFYQDIQFTNNRRAIINETVKNPFLYKRFNKVISQIFIKSMGCGFSETDHIKTIPFRSTINEQPRPRLLSFKQVDQDIKPLVWQVIENDDVKRLAFIIEKYEIDLRGEILHMGSYWTMLHFAARWNADLCAVFLLRKLYQDDPLAYVESVNMQTIEGYTPLQLAVMWNSYETYVELVELGGIDLSLKNTVGADIFIQAKSFKRDKMLQELTQFKNEGVFLIRINIQELSKPLESEDIMLKDRKQINQIREKRRTRNLTEETRRHKSKNFYKTKKAQSVIQLEEEIRKLVENEMRERDQYFRRLAEISVAQSKLRQEEEENRRKEEEENIRRQEQASRNQIENMISITFPHLAADNSQTHNISSELQRIEREKQQYEEELRIKNEEFLRKQKELQDQRERKQQEEIERQKLEEQKRLEEEARRQQELRKQAEINKKIEEENKRKQLEELTKKQQLEEIERIKKQQEEQRLLKQKQQLEKQKKLQEQTKKYNLELEQKKEQALKKATQPMTPSKLQKKGKGVGVLPPEHQKLYQDALDQKTKFTDSDFPPQRKTLGQPEKLNNNVETCKWFRPSEIFKSDYELFDGIDPSDIKQGSLGICYYLATLSSLAENQERIRRMFPFYDKELGFYVVSLYIDGAVKNIVVDDNFPCSAGSKAPLFTRPNGKEIWVMILEKAWVKNFGTYFAAEGMAADTMMEDVAGAPSKGAYIKNIVEELPFLAECEKNKYIIVLSSMADNAPKGIVAGHAYSLIDIHDKQDPQLIKIRNPWGSFQWEGDYGDKSNKWSKSLKEKLKVKEEEDGIFYMTPHEVPIGFSYYSVSMVQDNARYVSVQFTSQPQQQKYWTFEVKQKGIVNIRVTQLFNRMLPDKEQKEYVYSPLIFECGWIKSVDNVEMMGEGSQNSVFGEKSIHFHDKLFLDLQPGKYFIRVKMFWKTAKYNTARIVAYSTTDIQFTEVKPEEMKQQWVKMLTSILPTCSKSSILSGSVSLMQKWMKGQYIIGVTNNHVKTTYEITITLPEKDFKKCVLVYGRTKPNQVTFTVSPNQTKLAAIANKTELNASSSIGKFSISALAK